MVALVLVAIGSFSIGWAVARAFYEAREAELLERLDR